MGELIADRDANGYADPLDAFNLAFVFNLDRDANGYAGLSCTRKLRSYLFNLQCTRQSVRKLTQGAAT